MSSARPGLTLLPRHHPATVPAVSGRTRQGIQPDESPCSPRCPPTSVRERATRQHTGSFTTASCHCGSPPSPATATSTDTSAGTSSLASGDQPIGVSQDPVVAAAGSHAPTSSSPHDQSLPPGAAAPQGSPGRSGPTNPSSTTSPSPVKPGSPPPATTRSRCTPCGTPAPTHPACCPAAASSTRSPCPSLVAVSSTEPGRPPRCTCR